ncbi:tripartite motif-containing protein 3-like [Ptychodera flava]|uniref:tripartite motif-containing protein 3-like n=1 Tax=Ptychodera flava TaxID=63121 RepID=UPI00396A6C8F
MADDSQQQEVNENGDIDEVEDEQGESNEEEPAYKHVADFGMSDDGPEDARLKTPCGIAVSGKGDVFVADFGNASVKIYNQDGEYQREITHSSEKLESFYPGDIAITPNDEFLFILGSVNFDDSEKVAIVKCNYEGEVQKEIVHDKLKGGITIAVNNRGYVNVVDRAKTRVVIFDQDGKFLKAVGSKGYDLGKFQTPMYVCFTRRDFFIVTDLANRIQVFDPDGSVTRLIQQVQGPTGVSVDDDDLVVVGGAGITMLTLKGEKLGQIGDRHDGPNTRGLATFKSDGVSKVFAVCCKCSLPDGVKSCISVYQYDPAQFKRVPLVSS